MKTMLAHAIHKNSDALTLIQDPNWCASQKVDGDRLMVNIDHRRSDRVRYLSRKGTPYTNKIHPSLEMFFGKKSATWGDDHWIFDGEYLDGVYWVFDLIECPLWTREDTPPYSRRVDLLEQIVDRCNEASEDHLRFLPIQTTTKGKARLIQRIFSEGGEGVMFRRMDSPWIPGRSTNLLKFKAVDTADVFINEIRPLGKSSVAFSVFNEAGEEIKVGSVLMTKTTLNTLKRGDVIEVRYLYRGDGGRLVQPAFIKRRPDKIPSECQENLLRPTNKGVLT